MAKFPLTFLVSCLFLAACNEGGEAPVAAADGDLAGKWVLRSYRSTGYFKSGTLDIPLDEDIVFSDDRSYIDLQADRSFVSDMPAPESGGETTVEVGTWSVSGRTLTTIGSVDGVGEPDTVAWNISLNGTQCRFSHQIDEKDSVVEIRQTVEIDAVRK